MTNVGHHDDGRDRRDDIETARHRLAISVRYDIPLEKVPAFEEHLRKMNRGRDLFLKRTEEDALIAYFLKETLAE
jgi:hypothetical protein